jgi:hypothetical protein
MQRRTREQQAGPAMKGNRGQGTAQPSSRSNHREQATKKRHEKRKKPAPHKNTLRKVNFMGIIFLCNL